MKIRRSVFLLLLIIIVLAVAVVGLRFIKTVANVYVYGHPLMMMAETKSRIQSAGASENQLLHNTVFPDHKFRAVVRPNVDTLYTSAWLNLSAEPQVFSVPDTNGRYYVSPFMDAWTNVFAMIGKRTTGTAAGDYVLVGPNWRGELPRGLTPIVSPTNMVWMIQRIQTNGPDDVEAVTDLQKQFSLASLSQWQRGERTQAIESTRVTSSAEPTPYKVVDGMSGGEYLERLSALMLKQPPLPGDTAMLGALSRLGVYPDRYLFHNEGWAARRLTEVAVELARKMLREGLEEKLTDTSSLENGWRVLRSGIGSYGNDYNQRAGVSVIGVGALPPEEALYPSSSFDSQLRPLSGRYRYTIHFPAGLTPPADAFWSLTLYDQEGYLVDNSIARYAIGDRDQLYYNADKSLDIVIQTNEPAGDSVNWLPSLSGEFSLTLRIYSPRPSVLEGEWKLPGILRQ